MHDLTHMHVFDRHRAAEGDRLEILQADRLEGLEVIAPRRQLQTDRISAVHAQRVDRTVVLQDLVEQQPQTHRCRAGDLHRQQPGTFARQSEHRAFTGGKHRFAAIRTRGAVVQHGGEPLHLVGQRKVQFLHRVAVHAVLDLDERAAAPGRCRQIADRDRASPDGLCHVDDREGVQRQFTREQCFFGRRLRFQRLGIRRGQADAPIVRIGVQTVAFRKGTLEAVALHPAQPLVQQKRRKALRTGGSDDRIALPHLRLDEAGLTQGGERRGIVVHDLHGDVVCRLREGGGQIQLVDAVVAVRAADRPVVRKHAVDEHAVKPGGGDGQRRFFRRTGDRGVKAAGDVHLLLQPLAPDGAGLNEKHGGTSFLSAEKISSLAHPSAARTYSATRMPSTAADRMPPA